ncbi:MAG: polysaccharide biosynthesis C-terminal domain-containing protein, partial [Flavobacteriales bacterium]
GIVGVKPIILALTLGILSISVALSFSHYLSGRGLYHYLIKGSVIGLTALLVSGWLLIENYGLIGAGLATSFSYLASSIYLGACFLKESGTGVRDFLIKKEDLKAILSFFKGAK